MWTNRRFFGVFLEIKKQKRIPFLKNEPEKLLKTKDRTPKANRSEPESEPEKLLKTRACGKNEPKTNRRRTWRIVGPDLARQWRFARLSTLESELARGDSPESTQSRI